MGEGDLSYPIFFSLLLPGFASSHSQANQRWSRVVPKEGEKSWFIWVFSHLVLLLNSIF